MLRLSVLAGSAALLAALGYPPPQRPAGHGGVDTVQAGDPVLDPSVLRPFSLLRNLTLTRGDTVGNANGLGERHRQRLTGDA